MTGYRPEAESSSVHEAPETPDSVLKGKEMNSQEEKSSLSSTGMFINLN